MKMNRYYIKYNTKNCGCRTISDLTLTEAQDKQEALIRKGHKAVIKKYVAAKGGKRF